MTKTLTEEWIKKWNPCKEGIDWLRNQEERGSLKVLKTLIAENKLDWANWLIPRVMERKQYLAYAIYSAEQVLGIFEKEYPNDKKPRLAIEAAKMVLENDTEENRAAAYTTANAISDASEAMKLKILNYGMKLLEVKK